MDFVPEFTSPSLIGEEVSEEGSAKLLPAHQQSWKLFVDGSSNKEGTGVGIVLFRPEGNISIKL